MVVARQEEKPDKSGKKAKESDKENVVPDDGDGMGVTPRTKDYGDTPGGMAFGKHGLMPVLISDLYAEVQLPELPEFDPSQMKIDATVVAVGKRRTGKTWVFRNIMYLFKDKFAAGLVISQTDELNKFWRQYVPEKYIFNKYNPEILQAVFKRQKGILNDINKTEEEKDREAPFFILLDDVISDQRLKYDEALMELFVAGRHYRLFVLITTQYAKAITPTLRGNTDYCFMMKCIQQGQLEALWEDFGSFLTKDAFAQIINAYTEDNEVMVVNTCPECEVDPLSMLGWWKAIDPGPFSMGSVEYWRQAQLGSTMVAGGNGPRSGTELLGVKDIMPHPYQYFQTERPR